MLNVFSHPYQLEESISNFSVVGWYLSFVFNFQKKLLYANSGDPDLGMHCLHMSHKKDARLIWVSQIIALSSVDKHISFCFVLFCFIVVFVLYIKVL